MSNELRRWMILCEAMTPPDPRRHPRFAAWFGASKIVNADGVPMLCFHGTRARNFQQFSHDHTSERVMGHSPAFFFTANPSVANEYADDAANSGQVIPVYLRIIKPLRLPRYTNTADLVTILGPEVEALNDVISHTYGSYFRDVGRAQTYFYFKDSWGEHLIALAEKRGYDGVIFPETKTGRDQYDETIVAFHPNQIKSALGSGFSTDLNGLSEAGRASWP